MIYLTSDTHAGHISILNFCKRPFATVQEMDSKIIENWNSIVSADDEVYHLGDIAFGSKCYVADFIGKLNGHIHLSLGNHDYKNIVKHELKHLFEEVEDSYVITHRGIKCHLSHYPYLCWMGRYRFEPQFHGHVHLRRDYNGLDLKLMRDIAHPMQYDVGVDLNGFKPISIEEAINKVHEQQSLGMNCYQMWCMQ